MFLFWTSLFHYCFCISLTLSYFTWDKDRFPTSVKMLEKLSTKSRKMVNTIDPHLKRDDNYRVFADARDQALFVKDKNGRDFDGWCWPGIFLFL